MNQLPGVNQNSTSTASGTQRSAKNSEKACRQDSNEFSDAIKKKGKKTKGRENSEKVLEKSPDELLRSLKENAVTGMTKSESVNHAKAEVNTLQKADASEAVDRINKIVDRIMVAEAGATKEVKVSFNQDFLPGTEMLVRKDAGKLSVEFSTTSSESFTFLNKGEQSLASQLQNKLGSEVSIEIKMQENTAGQEQDGRSRNQFLHEENREDEE